MNEVPLIVICPFGIEAVVKQELKDLGFKDLSVFDGRIEFEATLNDIPSLNLWLRSADRVLIKLAEFKAANFDDLFDRTKAIPWDRWICENGKITVIGKSVKSALKSVRANQSIVKKAIIERLKQKYHSEWLEETGAEHTVQIAIRKDIAQLTLDTTGDGLHKRGYRSDKGEVPLRENLAAALVYLSNWKGDKLLMDPMCGGGTILIEAAMIGRNIAPGSRRGFIAEQWPVIEKSEWEKAREMARKAIKSTGELKIFGYDIDDARVMGCQRNAQNAGVADDIVFEQKDIHDLSLPPAGGTMITNPPYGVKLSNSQDIRSIYRRIDRLFRENRGWDLFLLTADKRFPDFLKHAHPDKVRKLFNGPLEVNFYQYFRHAERGCSGSIDKTTS